jgi:uncharacterized protein
MKHTQLIFFVAVTWAVLFMNNSASGSERTPETIRAEGNHLVGQGSLYLQQHAHNPIDWYPWGPEALEKAKREDKPIFLSIGYSSCHWCHVMEHEVFEHDDVAAYVNEHFVCIKVDREERPDLDAVYMDAVQAMTRRGGWPMSVFMTPTLKPFWGGTYLPHDPFLELSKSVVMMFTERRPELEQQAGEVAAHVNRVPTPHMVPVTTENISKVANVIQSSYDQEWGGFQQSQKFPTPLRWRFLLHEYRRTGDENLGKAIRHTLDVIDSGGIHDHLGGGFHRYTTERTWLVPHFEIMLYDNAQLASLYLEAAQVLDDPRYLKTGLGVLDFFLRDFEDPDGGLHASYDADSGGEEGSFYVWTPKEINTIAGDDGPALARLLGVKKGGNFEGHTILTRRVKPADEAEAELFDRWREPMYQVRTQRTWPGRDAKVVTAWNGLALSALAEGYALTGQVEYRELAERIVTKLHQVHTDDQGHLVRASTGGVSSGEGILDDYAFLASGLLDLHDATGNPEHLTWARELIATSIELFADDDGSWFLTPITTKAPLGRRKELFDSVEPAGASALVQAMLRLGSLTGDEELLKIVDRSLSGHASLFEKAGMEMAWWADTALLRTSPFFDVVIAGDPQNEDTQALIKAYHELAPSHAVLASIPAAGPDETTSLALPTTLGKTAIDGKATAYVCILGACKSPVQTPAELKSLLLDGRIH